MKRTPLTVYVDGDCPLCRREIALYKRLDKAGRMVWRDVAADPCAPQAIGVSCAEALRRIHAHDPEKGVITGAAVFAEIWRRIPMLSPFGFVMSFPPLSWLAEGAYRLFAKVRPGLSASLAKMERRGA